MASTALKFTGQHFTDVEYCLVHFMTFVCKVLINLHSASLPIGVFDCSKSIFSYYFQEISFVMVFEGLTLIQSPNKVGNLW